MSSIIPFWSPETEGTHGMNAIQVRIYSCTPLYFYDANTGFAVGGESDCSGSGCIPRGSIVLKTTDGGRTWEKQTTPAKGKLVSIAFVDDLTGFAPAKACLLKQMTEEKPGRNSPWNLRERLKKYSF